jgi:hypothetical protein
MKKNVEKNLDDFLGMDSPEKPNVDKKKLIDEKTGLIERVDRVLITKDGRQLLREQF